MSRRSGPLIVDITHWLTQDGDLPSEPRELRAGALRVARIIEYGADVPALHARPTLIECALTQDRRRCDGLLVAFKEADGKTIVAFCEVCGGTDTVVSNWQHTAWASGLAQPIPFDPDGISNVH